MVDGGSPNKNPPAAPTAFSASPISSSQIKLSWTDNSSIETGFKIERKKGATGTYTQIALVGSGVGSFNDTGLTTNTQYYYRVRATNSAGDSTYSNEANATTTQIGIPAAPSALSASSIS